MATTFFELQVKSGILIAISVLIYILLFSNDGLFNRNRAYLISSLFIPWIIPLLAMPVWVKNLFFGTADMVNTQAPLVITYATKLPITIQEESSLSWEMTGLYIYCLISIVLLIRLAWAYVYIIRLKQKAKLMSYKGLKLAIVQDKRISPFSFFRTIFLPKDLENNIDKQLVLAHEKAHSAQLHSIDILFAECLLVFYWWNPFAWWLRKLIAQNHDYYVDRAILKQVAEPKRYQYSLIKVLSGKSKIQLVNHFNKNLTKKRIIMMNKETSVGYIGSLKGFLIVPLIAILFLAFTNPNKTTLEKLKVTKIYKTINNKSVAVNTSIKRNKNIQTDENIPNKVNSVSKILKKIKGRVSSEETQSPIEGVKIYNQYGELLANTNKKGKFIIKPKKNDKSSSSAKDKPYYILLVKEGFQTLNYEINLKSNKQFNIELKIDIKNKKNKVENTNEITGFLNNFLINNNDKNEQPLYIIDGKVSTRNIINSLNHNSIESISVLKGKTATTIYGDKGKKGVITVSLKKNSKDNSKKVIISTFGNQDVKDLPLFMINGKESTKAELDKLDPESVESLKVIKGKAAIEKFGMKAQNGVVIIKLKETGKK